MFESIHSDWFLNCKPALQSYSFRNVILDVHSIQDLIAPIVTTPLFFGSYGEHSLVLLSSAKNAMPGVAPDVCMGPLY